MSKIGNTFVNGKAFIGFVTAGDPSLEKTEEFILSMERAGADLVEIGIPFSDPIAEGEVIQRANIRALAAGTTLIKVFEMVESVRRKTQVPLVFLTYLNPVFIYGYQAFFEKCKDVGIDGVVIPDLPFEERGELLPFAEGCGVDVISLIAPTSQQRIETIAKEAAGFIYCVSSMGVTGVRSEIRTDLRSMVEACKKVTYTPVAVGFGISGPEQAGKVASVADGVIVGSAIVKIIEQYRQDASEPIGQFVRSIKKAIEN